MIRVGVGRRGRGEFWQNYFVHFFYFDAITKRLFTIISETEKENNKSKQSGQQGSSEEGADDSKNKLPKAMVKPQAQILTHVIEGFVIQEASEPFPPVHKNGECDEPPSK